MLLMLVGLLQMVVGLGSLACFIMVIVNFFQKGEKNLAIISLVLILCGIGPLIAFVMGWVKAGQLGIQKIMMAWTGCIVAGLLFTVIGMVLGAGQVQQ